MITILLVDDHEILRDAIGVSLRNLGDATRIEGAATGEQALHWLSNNPPPDLVLLDIGLPDGNGITLLKTILRKFPNLKVAMLSGHDDIQTVDEAIRSGAAGFIPKTSGAAALSGKVAEILRGVITVSSTQLKWMTAPAHSSSGSERGRLTEMQRLVLDHLLMGWSNRQIADRLEIAEGTVKAHTSAIFKVFSVKSRSELIAKASL